MTEHPRFLPGQLLFKKRKKSGRAFRTLEVDLLKAAAFLNIIELKNEDLLFFIEIIEDAQIGGMTMPYAKVVSPYGVCYIQPSRLVTLEERERDDELGH